MRAESGRQRSRGKAKPLIEPAKKVGSDEEQDKKPTRQKTKAEKARKKKSRTKANKNRGKRK